MLDDQNVIQQRDSHNALEIAASQAEQTNFAANVNSPDNDGRSITRIVVAGMGGSALAALVVKSWLKDELAIPLEVVRSYSLPGYVDFNTLVIVSSYSGNTEEVLSCLEQARESGAQIAIVTAGGQLLETARQQSIAHTILPKGLQPRMSTIYQLRALAKLFSHFGVTGESYFDDIARTGDWLAEQTSQWITDVTTDKNYAKQLALLAVGKTSVFYAGTLMAPVAYKWKISWNETSKNLAFWNEYSEVNHNEFMGWTSHPVEKPFAVFDLVSSFEHPQILKRFEISDRLLSGKRPKAQVVILKGETPLQQMLWGSILADFISIYVAILNGVDPTPVELIEKLKAELA